MKNPASFFLVVFAFLLFSGCRSQSPVAFEEKGDEAFAAQRYGTALQFWIQSAKQAQNPKIYHKIGQGFLRLSNLDSAQTYLEKALALDPANAGIRKDLIRILLLKENGPGAEKHLAELEKQTGKDSDYFLLSGDARMMAHDFEQACARYAQGLLTAKDPSRPRIKAAICLARTGDEAGAAAILSPVENNRNLSARDQMLLADYYLTLRDNQRAESAMLQAARKDPADIMIQTDLCRFYLETGMKDKARDVLIQLESLYPENRDFPLLLADFFISEKKLENAESWLKKAEEKRGDRAQIDLLKGKLWLYKGKIPYAVSSLKSAVDDNPGFIFGHYLLGIAYFAGGQTKLAENSFIRALLLNPDHLQTLLAIAGLHYRNRDYDLAHQYLERVLVLDPLNPRGYTLDGLGFLARNENEKAASLFSKAWALGNDPLSLFFLGRCFENQDNLDRALEFYEQVLAENPYPLPALFRYSLVLQKMGKGARALETIDELLLCPGQDQETVYLAAWLSYQLGKTRKAIGYLNRAMKNQKGVPGHFYTLLAAIREKTGDENGAEQALQECMKLDPSHRQAWLQLAKFYLHRNSMDLAREVLEQGAEKFPLDPEIAGNLAWIYLETGTQLDRALDLARKAHEKLPAAVWLMDTLGWAYFHKQAYSQAEWILADAAKKEPGRGIINYHLGMVFYRQGKLHQAKETLKAALDASDLHGQDRETIKQVLAGLHPPENQDALKMDLILDPKTPLPFAQDEEDILVPDWSKVKEQ